MNFVDIPPEVISHNLLPLLDTNGLLRLRRVCKFTKSLVNNYIDLHVRSTKEIRIGLVDGLVFDEEENAYHNCISMKTLLEMDVPVVTSHFNLWYPGHNEGFPEHWNMTNFGEKFGEQITHLKAWTMTAPIHYSEKEMAFYGCLPNLKHLTVENLHMSLENYQEYEGEEFKSTTFPDAFQNLGHCLVKNYHVPGRINDNTVSSLWFIKLMETTVSKLEYIAVPRLKVHRSAPRKFNPNFHGFEIVALLLRMIKRWSLSNPGSQQGTSIKYFDMNGLQLDESFRSDAIVWGGLTNFMKPVRLSGPTGIKLLNVNAALVEPDGMSGELPNPAAFIVSLKDVTPNCLVTGFPFLQKISLETSACALGNTRVMFEVTTGENRWPNLQIMEMTINSAKVINGYPVSDLFRVLFGFQRLQMTVLKIKFDQRHLAEAIPIPRSRDIITSCVNLKKLTITNWKGTNKAISLLWSGLLRLEEICLEGCKELGNEAFVGKRMENPSFLQLRDLKKLSLKCINEMPKISDTVFRLVFCHVPLHEFILTCDDQKSASNVRLISEDGIRALLTGEFARSIKKFPFDGWRLRNLSEEQFRDLRDQFRCSHIL